jgi:hypothetical protein
MSGKAKAEKVDVAGAGEKRKPIVAEVCDEKLVDFALTNEGETTKGTLSAKVERLQKAFDRYLKKDPDAFLLQCDNCNGESPGEPRYKSCPFCGDGEETPKAEETPSEVVGSDESTERGDAAIVVGSESAAIEVRDSAELDAAVLRVRQADANVKGAFWDLGVALGEIERGRLYLARVGADGKPKYATFDQFVVAETQYTARHARDFVDLARNFSRDDAAKFGSTKLTPLLRLTTEEREEVLAGAEGKSVRQIRSDVAQIADGRGPRETGRNPHPPPAAQKPPAPPPAPTPPPAPPPREDAYTVVMRKGEEYKAPAFSKKVGAKRRAKKIEDEPVAVFDLGGGVGMEVRVVSTSTGLVFRGKAVELADPAAGDAP